MDVIGIICEYNPLHNGHIYQINKIKEMYPNSLIILILNGYFTERGEISYLTKEEKVRAALDNNIDIIVELPFVYGTQSADTFAYQSINFLNKLHVNKIVFGSETNNINLIKEIANLELSDIFDKKVKTYLDEGYNYPTSMAKALNVKDFLFKPNDLLGISYVKAINKINKDIEAISILRTNDYKDTLSNDKIISAQNIRNKIDNNENINKYTPIKFKINKPNYETYFKILKATIINNQHLDEIMDSDEGIDNRLRKVISNVNSLNELVNAVKTKRYTYNKINRLLVHILVGFTKKDHDNLDIDYVKCLGFNMRGKEYLNSLKDVNLLVNKNNLAYKYELKAALIYDLIMNTDTYSFEYNNKPIIKKTLD